MQFFGEHFYESASLDLRIPTVEKWKWVPAHSDLLSNLKSLEWKTAIWDTRVHAKRSYCLIIAEPDIEIGALLHTLAARKIPFLAIASPQLLETEFRWSVSGSGQSVAPVLSVKGQNIDLSLVCACFIRWGTPARQLKNKVNESRWKLMFAAWAESMKDRCIKLPGPLHQLTSSAQNRFEDWSLATRLGLRIPNTLISQDAFEISKFYAQNDKKILLRDATQTQISLLPKTLKIRALKKSDLPKENLNAPVCFQQMIEAKTHLRAVVVGEKVFCAKLEMLNAKSEADWRKIPVSHVRHTPYKLSTSAVRSIIKLARARGMTLATFDFILNKGEIYFLEMNRPGRWFYLELFAGLPIRDAIADFIIKQV